VFEQAAAKFNNDEVRKHNMSARDEEDRLLASCVDVARGIITIASDPKDANVFRVAAMVIESRLPLESERLAEASAKYFELNPDALLPAVDVVRNGWVISLPRLKDMLIEYLTRKS
jgi:hypothetical protein